MTEEEKIALIDEFKKEKEKDKWVDFTYNPQRDITTFELAQLIPLFNSRSMKTLEKLEPSCFRHLEPSWRNKKEEKAEGKKENKPFWRRIFS